MILVLLVPLTLSLTARLWTKASLDQRSEAQFLLGWFQTKSRHNNFTNMLQCCIGQKSFDPFKDTAIPFMWFKFKEES